MDYRRIKDKLHFGSKQKLFVKTVLLASLMTSNTGFSQELLYSMTAASGSSGQPRVSFASTDIDAYPIGTHVSVPLPDGSTANGIITSEHSGDPLNSNTMLETTSNRLVSLEGGGSVELHIYNNGIVGITVTDLINHLIP